MTRRILIAGAWDQGPGYPRADSLVAALLELGFDVEECRVSPPAWNGTKSELVSRPWRWPGWWLASRRARARLRASVRSAVARGPVDAVLVPYPGHVAIRWVRSVHRGPIVLDLFLSAYGTAVEDRGLFRPGSLPARALVALDSRACRAADLVLLDTPEHADRVRELTGLDASRFDWVPVSDPDPVSPTGPPPLEPGTPMRLLFFGTGVPLHGLSTWIEAVEQTPEVHLELFGGDPDSRARARERLGDRVTLKPLFAPMSQVRAAIDRSHVVAGILGASDKAGRVVPYKLVHGLAHGRAVVTADTPTVRRLLEPGVDCVVVPPGDAAALATELRSLAAEPSRLVVLGAAGRRRFETTFSPNAVAARLGALLTARFGLTLPRPGPNACPALTA